MSVICGNVAAADLAITRQTLNRHGESDGIRSYLETFFLTSFINTILAYVFVALSRINITASGTFAL